ncbi:hypothetical protein ACTXT7_009389 [Hymenolepis weldensis]
MAREADNRRGIRDWTLKYIQKFTKENVILMHLYDEECLGSKLPLFDKAFASIMNTAETQ